MEVCRRCGGIHPLIFNCDRRWRWVVNITPLSLYSEERTRYQLNGRLCGHQSPSGRFWEEIKSLSLAGIRTPDHPARALVSILSPVCQFATQYFQVRDRENKTTCSWQGRHNAQPATTNIPRDEVNAERVDLRNLRSNCDKYSGKIILVQDTNTADTSNTSVAE